MQDKQRYWLKLSEEFFARNEIRALQAQDNGDKFFLFYLNLLRAGLKTDGVIEVPSGAVENMIAGITNTNLEIVHNALPQLSDLHLLQMQCDGTIHLLGATELIGKETAAAERMRRCRARVENAQSYPQSCPQNEPQTIAYSYPRLLHCYANAQHSYQKRNNVTLKRNFVTKKRNIVTLKRKRKETKEKEKMIDKESISNAGARDLISYSYINIYNSVKSFIDDCLGWSKSKDRLYNRGGDWRYTYTMFSNTIYTPWMRAHLYALQLMDWDSLKDTFDRVGVPYRGEEIDNSAAYIWTAIINESRRRIMHGVINILSEEDEEELKKKYGVDTFRRAYVIARDIRDRNPWGLFNLKYAVERICEGCQGNDAQMLKAFDPFPDIKFKKARA